MFDLANYFASTNNARMKVAGSKSSSSSDETASTSSISSYSTSYTTDSSSSRRDGGGYNSRTKQHKYKNEDSTKKYASTPNDEIDDDDDDDEVVHIPPRIAFQIFELIELQRRCKDLYRRHQEKRRQSVMRANHSSYHSFTSEFESYCIEGELFV